jgi:hypothetical protein
MLAGSPTEQDTSCFERGVFDRLPKKRGGYAVAQPYIRQL